MKRILTTLSQKWPEYLIEAFVIVASILGAYALDNWNENRKERAEEQVLLESLLTDFHKNDTLIRTGIEKHKSDLILTRRMMEALGQKPDNYHKKVLDTLIVTGTRYSSMEIITSTLESIISGDQLTKIQNKTLRKELVEYPRYLKIYRERESLVRSITIDWIRPRIHKYISLASLANFVSIDDLENRLPSDYHGLAFDIELNNNFINRYAQLRSALQLLEKLNKVNQQLIRQLDNELNKS